MGYEDDLMEILGVARPRAAEVEREMRELSPRPLRHLTRGDYGGEFADLARRALTNLELDELVAAALIDDDAPPTGGVLGWPDDVADRPDEGGIDG